MQNINTPAQKMAYTLGFLWKKLNEEKAIHPNIVRLPNKQNLTINDFKLLFNEMMDKYIRFGRNDKRYYDEEFKKVAECIISSELKEENDLGSYFAMGQLKR